MRTTATTPTTMPAIAPALSPCLRGLCGVVVACAAVDRVEDALDDADAAVSLESSEDTRA